MIRLSTLVLLVAGIAIPQMHAYSIETVGEESNASITKKLDLIIAKLQSIEKRMTKLEHEPLAFQIEKPIDMKDPDKPIRLKWIPTRNLRSFMQTPTQEPRPIIEQPIDVEMLFDGYQRYLQRLR